MNESGSLQAATDPSDMSEPKTHLTYYTGAVLKCWLTDKTCNLLLMYLTNFDMLSDSLNPIFSLLKNHNSKKLTALVLTFKTENHSVSNEHNLKALLQHMLVVRCMIKDRSSLL